METLKQKSEVFGDIYTDPQRIGNYRFALMTGYKNKDKDVIRQAAKDIQKYVDSGFDDTDSYSEAVDDYNGRDPLMLARQYICHVFLDRYLDDDEDKTYIETGLKPYMYNWGNPQPVQLTLF